MSASPRDSKETAATRCWWFFHDWGRWETEQRKFTYLGGLFVRESMVGKEGVEAWQVRRCLDCGKIQQERLW